MFEGDWADIIPVRGLSQTTISKKKRGLVKKKKESNAMIMF